MEFPYVGEFILADGSLAQKDLETRWADKEFVSQIRTFTLVPKPGTSGWPLLRMHIPEKAKPVWVWRMFRLTDNPVPPEGTEVEAQQLAELRIYGIGYKKRGQKPHMMWVMPGGAVEAGIQEPQFAELIWKHMLGR